MEFTYNSDCVNRQKFQIMYLKVVPTICI